MSSPPLQVRLDRAALAAELTADIAKRLTEAVARRGAAVFVAAGGTTPGHLYDVLSKADVPWDRVTVTLSDERWVDANHPASNEGMVRRRLLQARASVAGFVGLKTPAATAAQALEDIDVALATLGPPDAALLGMGADGHVASLFPDGAELNAALDEASGLRVCAVNRPDAAGAAERVSLTRRGLLAARSIDVLIEGAQKFDVFRAAADSEDIRAMPIRMILNQRQTTAQFWWAP